MLDKVSKNIIKYRKEKNLSQLDLARAMGYKSAAYLGKAEIRKDNHHFNIKQIAKIAKILNINIELFFK
ncbi:MAG: helix-turn-helix domain-containing protein [Arcobacteraceae bacterium]|nr:helix-turn-helix domain-containing protein [Arcobacteraceae bacterium]